MFNRSSQGAISNWWWKVDRLNLALVLILILFGLVCVTSSSFVIAKRIDLHFSYFINKHIKYVICSIAMIIFISLFSSQQIKKLSIYYFIFFVVLVIATFFFGTEIKGSKRWLYFFGLSLQPSEFMKVGFALANARVLELLDDVDEPRDKMRIYIYSFVLCLFSMLLVVMQPDIGMACLIFATWGCQIFISGIPLVILLVPLILFIIGIGSSYFFFDHVHYRINNFIAGISNPTEIYQVKQAVAAFAKGGFFGVGPGQGKVKINLPDSHTDFIFSVIGEEFGVISCFLLIVVYVAIAMRSINKVSKERDLFNIFVVVGLSMQFLIQAMINIGVNIRLLPAKGMTLPFISYGGSSIMAVALLLGIILAINKKRYGNVIEI